MRSRPSACSSTAGCSCARTAPTALTGPVEALEVPETLHALIAARLDGLAPAERRLLQDAAVLGKTFARRGSSAPSPGCDDEVEPLLASLVRKEILTVDADPRSPERGQYGFLHALVQKVAYDTLSRKERKLRHLAVAELPRGSGRRRGDRRGCRLPLPRGLPCRARTRRTPPRSGRRRCEQLARAAERAASLPRNEEARRYFEQAPSSPTRRSARGGAARAGRRVGRAAGRSETPPAPHFEQADRALRASGETPSGGACLRAARRDRLAQLGRIDEAIERMEQAFAVLCRRRARRRSRAARCTSSPACYFFTGRGEARERARRARARASPRRSSSPRSVSQALNTKSRSLPASAADESSCAPARGPPDRARARPHRRRSTRLQQPDCPRSVSTDRFDEAPARRARTASRSRAAAATAAGSGSSTAVPRRALRHARARGTRRSPIAAAIPQEPRGTTRLAVELPAEVVRRFTPYRGELEPAGEHAQRSRPRRPKTRRSPGARRRAARTQRRCIAPRADTTEAAALAADEALELASSSRSRISSLPREGRRRSRRCGVRRSATSTARSRSSRGRASPQRLRAQRARAGARSRAMPGASRAPGGTASAAEASLQARSRTVPRARRPFWLAVSLLEQAEWLVGRGASAGG